MEKRLKNQNEIEDFAHQLGMEIAVMPSNVKIEIEVTQEEWVELVPESLQTKEFVGFNSKTGINFIIRKQ